MKLWLLDLANELHAAVREQSLPKLGLDRIWIRTDGRLVLLEFPAATALPALDLTPVQLLAAVADHGLSQDMNAPGPVPLKVRSKIAQWSGPNAPVLEEARAALRELSSALDRVSRWRRAVPIALAAVPFLIVVVDSLLVLPALFRVVTPEKWELIDLLGSLNQNPPVEKRLADPGYRTAVEQYLAGRHGSSLRDDAFWNAPQILMDVQPLRAIAADIAARYPSVSADEESRAAATIALQLETARRNHTEFGLTGIVGFLFLIPAVLVIGWCLISSAIVPGGFVMRMLGLAVVTRDGREIGRLRSSARILVAWFPAIVWLAWVAAYWDVPGGGVSLGMSSPLGIALAFLPSMIGAVWTIAQATRGLHDRVMGTWVVPR
jgi:hypothetical protein